ncbi:MAG TPA: folylpolyglutamate synthase/dihydrofolate synthase family protein [Dehalococcoidia bacterium]|nr:folylpolyglutamate synthase/dihydrofolate synthase family protein [Dehalococcoidia bacterium]
MSYDEAIEFLLSYADFERSGRFLDRPDLAPVLALLHALGDPHLDRLTVHVAGSKAKGSVAAMTDSILRAAGRRSGLYTSPHLHDYTERIQIDGEPIAQSAFASLTDVLREAVDSLDLAGRSLVTFDLLTALAFLAFRDARLDAQVVEVGLGGRLDSTNVFDEVAVAVITPLSLEHTAVLGERIEEIAAEKAGIIKKGCTVVLAAQPYGTAGAVVRSKADQLKARAIDVSDAYHWNVIEHDLRGQEVRIERKNGSLDVRIPLLGAHQAENASVAVAVADVLGLPDHAIQSGLAEVRWPGRLEVLRESPLIIADGAHNADSARRLIEALRDYFGAEEVTFVVGSSSDKDVPAFASVLAPLATKVIAARSAHPRAMDSAEIARIFREQGVDTENVDSVAAALESAIASAENDGVICLTGSLFVAAEGRAATQPAAG